MLTLFFVPINFHRCWPREWKRSLEACNYQYRIFHLQRIQANRYNYKTPRYYYRKHWCDSYGCCSHTRQYLSRKAPNMKDVISIQTLTKYIRVLKILSSVRFSIISLPRQFTPESRHQKMSLTTLLFIPSLYGRKLYLNGRNEVAWENSRHFATPPL